MIEEADQLEAVRAYHTQMRVMSSFLLSFVRTNELFSSMPVAPVSAPGAAANGR